MRKSGKRTQLLLIFSAIPLGAVLFAANSSSSPPMEFAASSAPVGASYSPGPNRRPSFLPNVAALRETKTPLPRKKKKTAIDPNIWLPDIVLPLVMGNHFKLALRPPATKRYKDYKQRRLRIRALGRAGTAIVPTALQALRNSKTMSPAVNILGNLDKNSADAIPILIDALHDRQSLVRYVAATTLARIARPVPTQVLDLLSHSDPGVRAAATTAVVDTGLYSLKTLPALERALTDPAIQVRTSMLYSVNYLRDHPHTIERLFARMGREENRLRQIILWQLSRMDMRPHLERLFPYADDGNARVRGSALEAIARGGRYAPAGRSYLIAALEDPSISNRSTVTWLLRRYKRKPGAGSVAILLRNMEAEPRWLGWPTARLLAEMGANASGAIPRLRIMEKTGGSNLRYSARYALKRLAKYE